MPGISEATDTDLKVIEELSRLGWKWGAPALSAGDYINSLIPLMGEGWGERPKVELP